MSLLLTILQKYPTMLNKDNENYHMNVGTSPKYGNAHRPMVKHGYHNKQNNQSRSIHRELSNDSRHNQNNQKRYDNYDSYDRNAHSGVIRVVNDGKHDDQRKYDNHDNHNRDKTRNGVIRVVNDGKHDQRKYDNYDNQNRYANARMNQTANDGRYDNQRRYDNYENYNRPNIQNRRGNQSRRDNYNRYDKQDKWEDIQFRRSIQSKQNNASRSEFVQRQNWDPIPAHTWRVVCDSMLGGLSSKLRMCGIDCIHVLFDQGGDDSARLAMRENRILLTRNKSYEKVRSVLHVYIHVYV